MYQYYWKNKDGYKEINKESLYVYESRKYPYCKEQGKSKVQLRYNMKNVDFKKGIKYEIFVGIKDKDSYEELLSVDDFKHILKEICVEKQINFSLITQLGGYTHDKGYTTETSMRVVIIGANKGEIKRIADWLKIRINTDTVLVTKTKIEYCFMK